MDNLERVTDYLIQNTDTHGYTQNSDDEWIRTEPCVCELCITLNQIKEICIILNYNY
jgi:hypothetical protein